MRKMIFLLFGILITQFSNAQRFYGKDAEHKIPGATSILLNEKNHSIESINLRSNAYNDSSMLELSHLLFGDNQDNSWELIRTETDQMGMVHSRYQQMYKNTPVEGNVFIYHSKNGFIQSANGDFEPTIQLNIVPTISSDDALMIALKDSLVQLKKENLSSTSSDIVVFLSKNKPNLAYKLAVFSKSPHVNKVIYIDALSGKVLSVINKMCSTDAVGIGHTQFSGVQTVTTNAVSSSNFVTTETGRGSGIQTLNAASMQPYVDADNNWNNVNANLDEFAMDAHFGAEATYDFYFNNFNRDSYDNAAGIIINYVNDANVGLNAYWSGGPENSMYYGNGDADHFPVVSLEVTAHELTHGVTEYSAGLIYSDESGALNESFSDIFGATIRFLNAPAIATWYIGDQLLHPNAPGESAFRNMANPNEFFNADCYNGLYFNNGDIVHYDSGIQNFWYYLLCNGGTGTNDLGDNYAVASIGMTDAMAIAYRNLAFYLTPSSTFMDARLGSEQAAIDLFGLCSPQHFAVVHAWYAVGVGPNTVSGQVNADFTISENFACVAPLTTSFGANTGYENYSWNFGDGNTSTLQNPTHVYAANGSYTVTLVVSNTLLCPGVDTETIVNAIEINPLDPVANFSVQGVSAGQLSQFTDLTTHNPTSWEWDFGDGTTANVQNPNKMYMNPGMYSVQLIAHNCAGVDTIVQQIECFSNLSMCTQGITYLPAGYIFDSGGASGSYQDGENCSLLIQLCDAENITFTMEAMSIEAWYDYLIIYDGPDATAPVLVTYTGVDLQLPYTTTAGIAYIEFTSDFSVTETGFELSYTSTPSGTPANSIVNFSVNTPSPSSNQTIFFTDASYDNPIYWMWNFGDGVTTTIQNPTHAYTANGVYTVTLTVTFCDGTVNSQTMQISVGGIGIDELESGASTISTYPNPSTDIMTIRNSADWSNVSIELIDITGRKMVNEKYNVIEEGGIQLKTAHFAPGNYLLYINYLDEWNQPHFTQRKIAIE
jgi:Zn-dependent metalloprotease